MRRVDMAAVRLRVIAVMAVQQRMQQMHANDKPQANQ